MPRPIDPANLAQMQADIIQPRWLVEITDPINLKLSSRHAVTIGDATYEEVPMSVGFTSTSCVVRIGSDAYKPQFTSRTNKTACRIKIGSMFGAAEQLQPWWDGYFTQSAFTSRGIEVSGSIYDLGKRIGTLCNATWARHLLPIGAKIVTRSGYVIMTNDRD